MSDTSSKNHEPITPLEYCLENANAWREFTQQTNQLFKSRLSGADISKIDVAELADKQTATQFVSLISDLNLKHFKNTARLLHGLPNMMSNYEVTAPKTSADEPILSNSTPKASKSAAPDDLTKIKGIGPALSKKLNKLGVYNFKQIASWKKKDVLMIDESLSFKGRVEREQWIPQAKALV